MNTNIQKNQIGGVPASEINVGRDENRVELYKVIPRSVPFALGITPSDVCNFKCIYCNQSTEAGIADARVLSWDDFMFLADQIQEMAEAGKDRIKVIRMIGNGEPLLNKRLPEMVAYIKKNNFADRIEVTTNGSLLSHEMSDGLIEAGLTRLLISVQGTTNEAYQRVCNYDLDYDKFVEQIEYFYNRKKECNVFIKTVDIALDGEEDRDRFFKIFCPISDATGVEKIIRACADVDYHEIASGDLAGETRYGTPLTGKLCCDTLFMYMNVHSNGDVDCCGCKYPPLYIGNIYKDSLKELWNGKRHREIMIKHLEGKRKTLPLCADCSSIEGYNGFPEDNIDGHRLEVLKRLQ